MREDEAAHYEIVEPPPAGLDWFGNDLVSEHEIPGYDSDDQDTVVDASEVRADPDSDDNDIEVITA